MKRWLVVATVFALLAGSLAMAGDNSGVGVTVHVIAHASKRSCSSGLPSVSWCNDLNTTEASADVDCFPVFYDLAEYLGCEYGLTWPGTYTCTFTSCSDLVIGDIVDPGDGISHTWFACRGDRAAIPGWARIYEPAGGRVCVTEHPITGGIYVLDCSEQLDFPNVVPSCAGIGGQQGDNPCGGDSPPLRQGTWGEIKIMFD